MFSPYIDDDIMNIIISLFTYDPMKNITKKKRKRNNSSSLSIYIDFFCVERISNLTVTIKLIFSCLKFFNSLNSCFLIENNDTHTHKTFEHSTRVFKIDILCCYLK